MQQFSAQWPAYSTAAPRAGTQADSSNSLLYHEYKYIALDMNLQCCNSCQCINLLSCSVNSFELNGGKHRTVLELEENPSIALLRRECVKVSGTLGK